jgi:hypothetical protein
MELMAVIGPLAIVRVFLAHHFKQVAAVEDTAAGTCLLQALAGEPV